MCATSAAGAFGATNGDKNENGFIEYIDRWCMSVGLAFPLE